MPVALEEALCKGLTVLAGEKPSQDPMAALAWLGDWLLNNNPLKPRIMAAEDLALVNIDDGSDFPHADGTALEERLSTKTSAVITVGCILHFLRVHLHWAGPESCITFLACEPMWEGSAGR